MTDPMPEEPKRSLTMQRIALNRSRTLAVAAVAIGIVLVVLSAVNVFLNGNVVIHLLQVVFAFAFLAVGIFRLRQAQRELRKFEDENGVGAGEQKPVS